MENKELTRIYRAALKGAIKGGKYLLKRYKKNDQQIKSDLKHDVKLDVDIDTENLIIDYLSSQFPHHGFICEESGYKNKNTHQYWIIDPLDGTVNFYRRIPHFCTSIAFREGKSIIAGAVYDPVKREMFSALKGKGAFLNNIPLKRQSITSLEDAVVSGGFFKAESLETGKRIFECISRRVKKIRFLGSAALDLCYLACGRFNVYIQHSVNEWDIAAASLIAESAGIKLEIIENNGKLDMIGADACIFEELKQIISE